MEGGREEERKRVGERKGKERERSCTYLLHRLRVVMTSKNSLRSEAASVWHTKNTACACVIHRHTNTCYVHVEHNTHAYTHIEYTHKHTHTHKHTVHTHTHTHPRVWS